MVLRLMGAHSQTGHGLNSSARVCIIQTDQSPFIFLVKSIQLHTIPVDCNILRLGQLPLGIDPVPYHLVRRGSRQSKTIRAVLLNGLHDHTLTIWEASNIAELSVVGDSRRDGDTEPQ